MFLLQDKCKFFTFIYFLCVHTCLCTDMHVGVKGLPIEVSSLLPPHGAWDFTLLAALVAGAFTCNVRQTVQNFIKN